MTSITVTTEVSPRGKIEDNSALYESIPAHIIEETEYVKKIRTTLEKIRNQMFKDEVGRGSTNHKLDTKCCGNIQNGAESEMEPSCCSVNSLMEKMKGKDLQLLEINKENEVLKIKCCGNIQNGAESEMEPSCCSVNSLMEKMKGKDLQLLEINKENEVLKIKLEASREAGAAALRNVAQRLFENYQTQSEEARKKHEDSKHILQVNKLEKEQELKQNVENLNQVAEKLEEKHSQITELENLVQRMEKMFDSQTPNRKAAAGVRRAFLRAALQFPGREGWASDFSEVPSLPSLERVAFAPAMTQDLLHQTTIMGTALYFSNLWHRIGLTQIGPQTLPVRVASGGAGGTTPESPSRADSGLEGLCEKEACLRVATRMCPAHLRRILPVTQQLQEKHTWLRVKFSTRWGFEP
ncbi:Coiled-coil domain-containing protein 68 [Tupaia chinensis]|uniref:Coiled-coil domain-containing protein 68 n=1 Tax=Tupaia chinensis TaxID=246437 RepID=L9L4U7_TUPCH|nr:Coiled-coil domain-containing protein 68 [Tupaia chinensis]